MLGLLYLTSFVASLAGVEIQAAPIWSLRHRGWTLTPSFEVSCDEVGQIWTVEHRMIQFETDEEDPGSYTLVHKPIPGETHYFGHQIMQSDARIGFEGYVVPVKIWIDEVIDHHALASDLEQELYEVCCRIRVEFLIDIDLATGATELRSTTARRTCRDSEYSSAGVRSFPSCDPLRYEAPEPVEADCDVDKDSVQASVYIVGEE